MSTIVTFGNRNVIEPGVYSQVKANVNAVPVPFSYGNVLIIDIGEGKEFGGGSGISGELANNLDAIYSFDTLQDARSFVRGGLIWDLLENLFIPVNGAQGASKLFIVRAAQTTPAEIKYELNSGTNGGTFTLKCKNEGKGGNGVTDGVNNNIVRKGYAALLRKGIVNSNKYMFEFYEGTFKGLDADQDPYDGIKIDEANPILIARSAEFTKFDEFIEWAKNDYAFFARFHLAEYNKIGDGTIEVGDFTANNTLKLATGGTETYSTEAYDKVLNTITEVDFSFVLSLKHADNALGAENTKLLYHLTQQREFKAFMVVGGGNNELKFDQTGGSIEIAETFNSPYAIVCHSGYKEKKMFTPNEKNRSSLYHAAAVCGRIAGLQPQTSATFKTLKIKKWNHQLTQPQREKALQAGVLHNRFVPNLGFVINQAINTLQKNTQLYNADGTSHEISIMRIAEQLNKELILNMRPLFIGQNLNTASPADIKSFVEGYLTFKTATRANDNLIIRFENVSVVQKQDYYEISYSFVANSPVNKLFVTGFMIESSLSA